MLEPDGSPVEQLHRLVDFQIGWFRENPHFGRLFLRSASAAMLTADALVDERVVANYDEVMRLQADLFARGQASGELHPGDPEVLARLFSGLMAAYQALDPQVVSDAADAQERFPLAELHELVDRTFVR